MTESKISLILFNQQQGYQQLLAAWSWIKAHLTAGHRIVLEARLERRSDAQNRVLHSRLNDVSKHCQWAGKKWDVEDWKRLMTAAWCRTRSEGVEMVPAIDGTGFDVLYQRTSKLSRAECADLSEYVIAWGTAQCVQWCVASLCGQVDQETGEIMGNT